MTIFGKFVSFVSKYGTELASVSDALSTIVSALPLNRSDKVKVEAIIQSLDTSVDNILKGVKALDKESKVVIKKSDIVEIVKEVLPEIVRSEMARIAKDVKDAK